MTRAELQQLQALPLELKIEKSKARIREWVYFWGKESVYIAFSGGKDSTVLLDIVRQEFKEIEPVFVNTGLEYPEIVEFVKTFDNVRILKPKKDFLTVIKENGYPIISKDVANTLEYAQKGSNWALKRNEGLDKLGVFSEFKKRYIRWAYLTNAPFKISNRCCDFLKKEPLKKYEKETGKVAFTGQLVEESTTRTNVYLKQGCNAFENKRPVSNPLGFWTEKDIHQYIFQNKLKVSKIYGEQRQLDLEGTEFEWTGAKRTGCMFCLFGIHLEKGENRIQKLKKTHPNIYDYIINKLEFGKVIDLKNKIKY